MSRRNRQGATLNVEARVRIELTTYRLRGDCSTIELPGHVIPPLIRPFLASARTGGSLYRNGKKVYGLPYRLMYATKGWLRGRDLNPRPFGHEPNELPLLYPASMRLVGLEPTTHRLKICCSTPTELQAQKSKHDDEIYVGSAFAN